MKEYRESVIDGLKALVEARGHIFVEVLNLATAGEMKDIMSAFENGDSYDFELVHFEDCEDRNIKRLIKLLKKIEKVYFQIKDDNGILEEEI